MEESSDKYIYKNTAEKFEWPSLIIATILMLFGIFGLIFSWGNRVFDIENLINYVSIYNVIVIFAVFFAGVGIYIWYWYVVNVLIKPEKATVFLKEIEKNSSSKNILTFIDSKGKKYMLTVRKSNNDKKDWIELNTYYQVLKTRCKIYSVISTSNDSFPLIKKRESFWMNWYTPVGDFKNIFLLPIVYLSFIALFSAGIETMKFKLWTGIPVAFFVLLNGAIIVYDICEKMKRYKKSQKTEL